MFLEIAPKERQAYRGCACLVWYEKLLVLLQTAANEEGGVVGFATGKLAEENHGFLRTSLLEEGRLELGGEILVEDVA